MLELCRSRFASTVQLSIVGRLHRPASTCPFREIKIALGYPPCYINANQGTYICFVYIAEGFYTLGFYKSL